MGARRRAALAALLAVLALAGCGKTLQEVSDERDLCHELGGRFETWPVGVDSEGYGTSCDLSDPKED